jgi:hypothetical protein
MERPFAGHKKVDEQKPVASVLEGKKSVLEKKQLRLTQPEKSHSNRNAAFRTYCLWA